MYGVAGESVSLPCGAAGAAEIGYDDAAVVKLHGPGIAQSAKVGPLITSNKNNNAKRILFILHITD
jgi:hypothetical protein